MCSMIVASNRPRTSVKLLQLLLGALLLGSGLAAAAQNAEPATPIQKAISHAQQPPGRKGLSANTSGPIRRGRGAFEPRIRVLSPNGHIRVISIYTDAAKSP